MNSHERFPMRERAHVLVPHEYPSMTPRSEALINVRFARRVIFITASFLSVRAVLTGIIFHHILVIAVSSRSEVHGRRPQGEQSETRVLQFGRVGCCRKSKAFRKQSTERIKCSYPLLALRRQFYSPESRIAFE